MTVHTKMENKRTTGSQELLRCAKNLEFSEKVCSCKHELSDTGAIFLRSYGVLYCNECSGLQSIKHEIR